MMEIFVRDIPSHVSEKQAVSFFRPYLARFDITVFRLNLIKKPKTCVNIIVLDAAQGQRFIARYGVSGRLQPPKERILWGRMPLKVLKGRQSADHEQVINELQFEASEAATHNSSYFSQHTPSTVKNQTRFNIMAIECEYWTYEGNSCVFAQDYHTNSPGQLVIGMGAAIVALGDPFEKRIDFPYSCCEHVTFGNAGDPTVTFTITQPPKMYSLTLEQADEFGDLANFIRQLRLSQESHEGHQCSAERFRVAHKERILGIDNRHAEVAGLCMVYKIRLKEGEELKRVHALFKGHTSMPSTLATLIPSMKLPHKWHERLQLLSSHQLADTALSGGLPFTLRFQLESLSRNASLPPQLVMGLLPKIHRLQESHSTEAIVCALLRFHQELPSAGPFTDAHELEVTTLGQKLESLVAISSESRLDPYVVARKHKHIVLVHRVLITPTGCLLQGPFPEPANRVLRRFSDHSDHFLRVSFVDEDGASLGHDPRSGQDTVFLQRYKSVLAGAILIAGEAFSLMGFSHSSLRAHTCWFMARFVVDGTFHHPEHIIKLLGRFDDIRIPAKCAARIGQNFTDTNSTVQLAPSMVGRLEIVERNGRDFSDGVGTISSGPGAKGMVSLDTRLSDKRLMLRQNMIKFAADTTWDLEVCGAAFRPLPMVLNRDLIKLLEDLGIPNEVFLTLQEAEIARLCRMTTSATDAVVLLQDHHGLKDSRFISLLTDAAEMGIHYHEDEFMATVVELGVISMLQDIKYRGRIPVPKGCTLYGIMDETGYLKEGEVFIATEKSPGGGRQMHVQDRVLISRSQALHAGDAQVVSAVDVPVDSPLRALSNCVVFSQHGARDLPSQLSGGDLDGDVYHIILDRRLIPDNAYPPADYPKIEVHSLSRPVALSDIVEFFIQFYRQDTLGMICNTHTVLADLLPGGTANPMCIKLAELASTAVDYSKTGVPVDIEEVRKLARSAIAKPHFMAPSPRILIGEDTGATLELQHDVVDEDVFDGLDRDQRRKRWYHSKHVLGQLFDAIDEKQFLKQMQQSHGRGALKQVKPISIPAQVLAVVRHYAHEYGLLYKHHAALASVIEDGYNDSLMNLLECYSSSPREALLEVEAVSGVILGRRSGPQGKALRTNSKEVRERLANIVDHTMLRIKYGDQTVCDATDLELLPGEKHASDRELEGLPRAIAALEAAINMSAIYDHKRVVLKSFAYVAASVCLEELRRYRITTLGLHQLPNIAVVGSSV